jgi:hypothetical protein
MADIQDFFLTHARVSHKTLARFAAVDPHVVEEIAEDLGFGPLLRFDEAEEILFALANDEPDDDEDDEDLDENDDTDEDGEAAEEDESDGEDDR